MPIVLIYTRRRACALAAFLLAVSLSLAASSSASAAGELLSAGVDPFENPGPGEILRYAPDRATSLISLRLEGVGQRQALAELRERSRWLAAVLEGVERNSGGTLDDVDRVTLCGRAGEQPLAIITLRDRASLEQRLQSRLSVESYRRETIGSAICLFPQGRCAALRTAFAQPSENTFLFGPERLLVEILTRNGSADLPAALRQIVGNLDYVEPLAAAFDLGEPGPDDSPTAGECFGVSRAWLRPFRAIGLNGALHREAVFVARLACSDADTADNVRRSLNFGRGLADGLSQSGSDFACVAGRVTLDVETAEVIVHGSLSRDRLFRLVDDRRTETVTD